MIKRNGPGGHPGPEGSLLHNDSELPTTDTARAQVAVTSSGFAGLLCAELRCASARSRLITTEIDAIGVALKAGLIDCNGALNWLDDCGASGLLVIPSSINLDLAS